MMVLVEVLTWKIDVDFNLCNAISIMKREGESKREGKNLNFLPFTNSLVERVSSVPSKNFVARLVPISTVTKQDLPQYSTTTFSSLLLT